MKILQHKPEPCAYIITCRTYGTWLHGDSRGSVDRKHNQFLTPRIEYNSEMSNMMRDNCKENPFLMNAFECKTVLQSIIDTCQHAQWHLFAAHVRTNHMHIVLKAYNKPPEQIAISLKAYATRYLKKHCTYLQRERFWSRGASTGYIYQSDYVFRAIQYTIEEQGKKIACYCDPEYIKVLSL